MLKKIQYAFKQTRIPYIIAAVITTVLIGAAYNNMNQTNHEANRIVCQLHARNATDIKIDQHKIFNDRSQLQSLQDDHTSYLLQDVFKRLQTKSHLKPSQFHYEKQPSYIKMTAEQAKINNRDNTQIHHLQSIIDRRGRVMKHEHKHMPFTNVALHKNYPVFMSLFQDAIFIAFLLVTDLICITRAVKYKDLKLKEWQKQQAAKKRAAYEARRQSYIREFGDDKGFKESEKERRIFAKYHAGHKPVAKKHSPKKQSSKEHSK